MEIPKNIIPEDLGVEYVIYYRVSTQKQGRSGLGLAAQKDAVDAFIGTIPNAKKLKEFVEVESGKNAERPELNLAINYAKNNHATLLVAKLDRLSRDLHFITTLEKSGVDFVCADMPDANKLTIHLIASIAQHERELISQRTRAALTQAKKRGVKLGSNNPKVYEALKSARKIGNKKSRIQAKEFAKKMQVIIEPLLKAKMSKTDIVNHLNACGVKTYNDCEWDRKQLYRVMYKWHGEQNEEENVA